MTPDQFWHGDPRLVVSYRKLHRLKIEQRNQELWLQGLYNLDALSVALNNSFSKQKAKYIAEPFRLFPKTEDEKRAEAEEIRRKFAARLDALKQDFDRKHKEQA